MGKKEHEIQVFEELLLNARAQGGEARRIVDRLTGEYVKRDDDERPDIVIKVKSKTKRPDKIIGIEHFAIDHLNVINEKKNHRDSQSIKIQKEIKQLQAGYSPEPGMTNKNLEDFSKIIEETLAISEVSSYKGFLESFQMAANKHLKKTEEYLENLKQVRHNGETVEQAFLIEIHSDFSKVLINDKGKVFRCEKGKVPVFQDIFLLLEALAEKVDYLLLTFYPPLSKHPVDSLVLQTDLLKQSLRRQRRAITNYYSPDRFGPLYEDLELSVSFSQEGEQITFFLDREGKQLSPDKIIDIALEFLPNALIDMKEGVPFVTNIALQFLLEVFGNELKRVNPKKVSRSDLPVLKNKMGIPEYNKRIKAFQDRFLKDDSDK